MLKCPPLRDRVYRSHTSIRDLMVQAGRGQYKTWDEEHMESALKAVISEGYSVRRASEVFNVPRSTLGDRVSGRVVPGTTSGPERYLTAAEENELVQFLTRVAAIGYGKSRKEVMAIAQRVVEDKGLNRVVSNGWWETFCRRNPNISLRASAPLSIARAKATDPEMLSRYFDLLERTFAENDLTGKPNLIFNMDESGVPLDPKSPLIVAERGSAVTTIGSGNKTQVTIVACVSAAGFCMPPMVIWNRKVLASELTHGEVEGTLYGLSGNGWMDRELFALWFKNHFLNYIPSARPVLLLMDGHSSHYCPNTIRLAAQEQVILFALPPNTTHLSQPLDKGCFGPLKVAWREECHRYVTQHPGRVVTKFQFSSLFRNAWLKSMTVANITGGFRVTGVYPVNRNALSPPQQESETLSRATGLSFIPLYSPCRRTLPPVDLGSSLIDSPAANHDCSFTEEEITLFKRRYENGYDVVGDDRYRQWLCKSHPDATLSMPFTSTSVQKCVSCPTPPSLISSQKPKSCGRVLTSAENMKIIEEKEKLKKRKEEAKMERDEARRKKALLKSMRCTENSQERQTRTGTSSRATRDVTTTRKTLLKDKETDKVRTRTGTCLQRGKVLSRATSTREEKGSSPEEVEFAVKGQKRQTKRRTPLTGGKVATQADKISPSSEAESTEEVQQCQTRSSSRRGWATRHGSNTKEVLFEDKETDKVQTRTGTCLQRGRVLSRVTSTREEKGSSTEEVELAVKGRKPQTKRRTPLTGGKAAPQADKVSPSTEAESTEEVQQDQSRTGTLSSRRGMTTRQNIKEMLSSSFQDKETVDSRKPHTKRHASLTGGKVAAQADKICPSSEDQSTGGSRVSKCQRGVCAHPKSVYWVQCEKANCEQWYHCRCVGVLPQRAKQADFSFYCCV